MLSYLYEYISKCLGGLFCIINFICFHITYITVELFIFFLTFSTSFIYTEVVYFLIIRSIFLNNNNSNIGHPMLMIYVKKL